MANLGKAIEMVADGQQYFSPELNGKLAKRLKQYSTIEIPQFTSKEIDVLRFLAKGLSSDEIAGELNMSRRTVEGYRAKLLEKTESTNTINLIIYALRNKLIIFDELEPEKNS
jgi:DNA-binding NarL/FixJ family response regulator